MFQLKKTGQLTSEFNFTKEELAILDPLEKRKDEVKDEIRRFVSTKVIPRVLPELNMRRKYNVKFDIKSNSLRIRDMSTMVDLTPTNRKEVLTYGKKTIGR